MAFSPAFSTNSDMSDAELDKYFASYVPLSNLPTPPQAKVHAATTSVSPRSSPCLSTSASISTLNAHDTTDCPEYEAYATHLANLVPLNVSTHRPHVSVIQGFLSRAKLLDEMIAYSACILDALSSRFAATWRDALEPSGCDGDLQNFLKTDSKQVLRVSPDVIVLAALSLAHGFLSDRGRTSLHWSVQESNGAFMVKEIESTTRAILTNMDYGLFRISGDRVQRRLRAMQMAIAVPSPTSSRHGACEVETGPTHSRNVSAGSGGWSHGLQTPEPSP